MKFPSSLSLRWLDTVSNFKFTVEYRKAELHEDADFLKRHVMKRTCIKGNSSNVQANEEEEEEESSPLVINEMKDTTSPTSADARYAKVVTAEEFKEAQDRDHIIQLTKEWLEFGMFPDIQQMLEMPIELRQYIGILPAHQILEDGLLVRKKLTGEHIEMRETIMPCQTAQNVPHSAEQIVDQRQPKPLRQRYQNAFHAIRGKFGSTQAETSKEGGVFHEMQSTDGHALPRFLWEDITTFERVPIHFISEALVFEILLAASNKRHAGHNRHRQPQPQHFLILRDSDIPQKRQSQ